MQKIETVDITDDAGNKVAINKSDYDPTTHILFGADAPAEGAAAGEGAPTGKGKKGKAADAPAEGAAAGEGAPTG